MSKHTVQSIIDDYIGFFAARGHEIVPSAPLLPDDPTLLFTAAGMVPFKAYFNDPPTAPWKRAVSVQKCLRAGGKQSDLENVGRTLRHHTFFEMLGNFSFGDYFKKEAIEWGWELSIDVWKLDPDRIWISVFEEDDEAFDLWEKHIGFPKKRIVRMGRKDNFWGPVGDIGVCGPSSEMHYDTGRPGAKGGPGDDGGDRYIEYWNLVFPQFFYTEAGNYDPLPKPGIDTGLGVERIAFILQDAKDNFHTDEFLPIREAVARAMSSVEESEARELAINAAADHVRALTFALAEGIVPSNEGRGYVLRRLLRRALTKVHPFGVRDPFLAGAVDAVVKTMGQRYPDLAGRAPVVKEMITAEEERFLETLELGIERLDTLFEAARKGKKKQIAGADVFQLYDTFGFPPELTGEMAADAGLTVDQAGYEAAMKAQRDRARSARVISSGDAETTEFQQVGKVASSEFVGYDSLSCDADVIAVRDAGASRAARRGYENGRFVELATDRTVFYPEGGGQVGDVGMAEATIGGARVVDTYRVGERIAHVVQWTDSDDPVGVLRDAGKVHLEVDASTRRATERNHTATHLLHAALREVLGDHVTQAGSLVAPDRLRFDFHHYQAMKSDEIETVERIVNEAVMADAPVTTAYMHYKDAVAAGAMALFGEKYGDEVRVVTIEGLSRELCGGTHLSSTGAIGPFVLRAEGAVGSGVRRVEALTGTGSLAFVKSLTNERARIAELLKVAPEDVERRLTTLLDEVEEMRKHARRDEAQRARDTAGDAISGAEDIDGLKFVAVRAGAADVGALRQYGDALRDKLGTGIALVCQDVEQKPVCLVVVSDTAIQQRGVKANDLTRAIGEKFSLRGGGKPHMAQIGLGNIAEFEPLADFVKGVLQAGA